MYKSLQVPTAIAVLTLVEMVGAAELSIIVPNTFADTEGDAVVADLIPDYRLQMIVAADQFNDLPRRTNLLTHLAYRVDGSVNTPHTYTADKMTLRLSTTEKEVSELSDEFALNIGPDEFVGFDDQVSWSTDGRGPNGGPKGYDFGLAIDPPFPYTASQGNLLIDLTVLGGSSPLLIDFTVPTTDSARFVWSGTNGVDSPIAETGTVFGGDILELRFEAVPEPATVTLLVLNCLFLSSFMRRVRL